MLIGSFLIFGDYHIYFKGDKGSESIIKVAGGSEKYCCISGCSYFAKKSLIYEKFENKLFANPDMMEKHNGDPENKMLEKINKMTLPKIISGNIEKK